MFDKKFTKARKKTEEESQENFWRFQDEKLLQ